MSEDEYILVSNKERIKSAIFSIKSVMPNNIISRDDLDAVMRTLYIWQDTHFSELSNKVETDA